MVGRGHKHIWSMVVGGHREHIWREVVGSSVSTYWGWCWVDLVSPFGKLLLKWNSQKFCFHSVLHRKKQAGLVEDLAARQKFYQKTVCQYIADYKAFKNKFPSVLFSSNPGKTFSFFQLGKLTEKWNCFSDIILLSNDKVLIDKLLSLRYGEMTTF